MSEIFQKKNYPCVYIVLLYFSVFLGNIKAAYDKNPELSNLLMDQFFCDAIDNCQESWRHVVANAVTLGIPTPAFSTALAFYDGFRSETLPANLIQVCQKLFFFFGKKKA